MKLAERSEKWFDEATEEVFSLFNDELPDMMTKEEAEERFHALPFRVKAKIMFVVVFKVFPFSLLYVITHIKS